VIRTVGIGHVHCTSATSSAACASTATYSGPGSPSRVGLGLAEGEDLDTAVQKVERAGGTLIQCGEHVPGVVYAYVADPDGNVIEL
jgi:predicted enzyme related to lactoylglutathione lyase